MGAVEFKLTEQLLNPCQQSGAGYYYTTHQLGKVGWVGLELAFATKISIRPTTSKVPYCMSRPSRDIHDWNRRAV